MYACGGGVGVVISTVNVVLTSSGIIPASCKITLISFSRWWQKLGNGWMYWNKYKNTKRGVWAMIYEKDPV